MSTLFLSEWPAMTDPDPDVVPLQADDSAPRRVDLADVVEAAEAVVRRRAELPGGIEPADELDMLEATVRALWAAEARS